MKSYSEIVTDSMAKRCGQLGFKGIDGNNQCLYAIREYVMPECVGCMVKVRHEVYIRMYSPMHIELNAVMFNRPYDTETNANANTKCIEIYNDSLSLYDNEVDEYCDFIEERINRMFNRIDEKLKNVLGMERIA